MNTTPDIGPQLRRWLGARTSTPSHAALARTLDLVAATPQRGRRWRLASSLAVPSHHTPYPARARGRRAWWGARPLVAAGVAVLGTGVLLSLAGRLPAAVSPAGVGAVPTATRSPTPIDRGPLRAHGPFGPLPSGRYLIPAGGPGPPLDLTFVLDRSTSQAEGYLASHYLELAAGPASIELWWRFGGVDGDPCRDPTATETPGRSLAEPSSSDPYEVIRSIPEFEVTPERPFRFAGATGSTVDIAIRPDARGRCAAARGGDAVMLTGAGRGIDAGHIVLPLGHVMRLGRVEVEGHELVVAVIGASTAELDAADAVLSTFEASSGQTKSPESPPGTCAGRLSSGGHGELRAIGPAAGPTEGRLAFLTDQGLWIISGPSTDPELVATTTGDISDIAWSPDGTHVLVASGPRAKSHPKDPCWGLYLVAVDGAGIVEQDDARQGDRVGLGAMSPDGSVIAYEVLVSDQPQIRTATIGGPSRLLAQAPCPGDAPVGDRLLWSPDGRYLAVRCDGSARTYAIADGTHQELVLPSPEDDPGAYGPATIGWADDGHTLLVVSYTTPAGGYGGQLHVAALDAADGTVSTVSDVTSQDIEWVEPFPVGSVSSTGRQILALGGMPGVPNGPGFRYARHVIDVATGADRVLLTPTVDAESAAWTPDGGAVLFTDPSGAAWTSKTLWRTRADGTGREAFALLPSEAGKWAWHP